MRNYPLLLVIYRVNNSLSLHKNSVLVEYFVDVAPKMLIGDMGKISKIGKMNFYSSLILRFEIKKSAPNLSLDADFVVFFTASSPTMPEPEGKESRERRVKVA